jgi:arylsulfatase A-like enzyme
MPRQRDEGPRHPCAAVRLGLLAVVLVLLACGRDEGPARVLLVSIDTLRADHVGAGEGAESATPVIDALADQGTMFAQAISPTPLTLPSHTTLLTGLDPPRHGVHDNGLFRLAPEIPTLAATLRAAGFATGGFVGAFVLDRQYGLDRGFDLYGDRMSSRRASGSAGFAERRADAVVEDAKVWLATAPDRWFAWVHFYDPHADYDPPESFRERFPADPYRAEIAYADHQLGELTDFVLRRWPDGRTMMVVTSDHGESRGEHGELTHFLTLYDATQRVPLVIVGPGVPAGRVIEAPVRLADVAPTVLAALGVAPDSALDGRDLAPLWSGAAEPAPPAYLETFATHHAFGWSPLYGLRTATHKYLRAPRPELYDLAADPAELVDLAQEESALVAELDALLEARFEGGRPVTPSLAPDAEERARLESLGYVVSDAAVGGGLVLGSTDGLNPADQLHWLRQWQQGLMLLGLGRASVAYELLSSVQEGGVAVELTRADAALDAALPEAAEGHARAALAQGAEAFGAKLALAEALAAQGRIEEAEALYREELARESARAEAQVGLGRLAELRGDPEAALGFYAEARAEREGSPEAVWRSAAIDLEAGRVEQAREGLVTLPAALLDEPRPAVRLVRAETAAGRLKAANQRLARALAQRPQAEALLALQAERSAEGTR